MTDDGDAKFHSQVADISAGIDRLKKENARLREVLRITAGNIRSLGPAGALDQVPMPYREWLAVVDAALARVRGDQP